MYICDFSRSVGAGRATTRNTRGLTRSVIRLIVPPFPAVSRPSNTTQKPSGLVQLEAEGVGELCLNRKAPGLPLGFALEAPSFALEAPGLPFSFALKTLDLPFIPGGQALEGAGPALLTQPPQRPEHDGADDHPLLEAGAPQHVTQHAQPDQPQHRLTGKARVPRLRSRPAAAGRDTGQRRSPGTLS
jgi:hypothetical protein